MAQLTFLATNTPARQMSRRIPQETWNRHKAEIVQQYRLGGKQGVARVLQWISKQPFLDVRPTRRQLEYQLKVIWQVDEVEEDPGTSAHNGAATTEFEVDNDGLLGCPVSDFITPSITTYPDSSTSQTISQHGSSPSSATSQPGPLSVNSDRGKRKAVSMDFPIEPSQKRRQEANSDGEGEMGSTFPVPDFTSQLEERPSPVSEAMFRHSLDNETVHRTGKDMPKNLDVNVDVISDSEPLIDPQRLLTVLGQIGVRASQSQVRQLLTGQFILQPFGVEELKLINAAADFFASGLREAAFPLYLALTLIQKNSPAQSDGRFRSLLSCAFAAISIADLKVVRDLFVLETSRATDLSSTKLEKFLLTVTLMLTYQRLNDISEYKNQLWIAIRIFYDLDTLQSYPPYGNNDPERIQLDLTHYYIIDFAFRFLDDTREKLQEALDGRLFEIWDTFTRVLDEAQDVSLKTLAVEFLHQSPGPFGLKNGVLMNPCIRRCLNWCLKKLRGTFSLPRNWNSWRQLSINKKWVDWIGIYWFLWKKWNERSREPGFVDDLSDVWTKSTENVMGISAPELLSEMASLMLEASSSEEKMSRVSRRFIGRELFLIQCATEGAKVLNKLTDQQLAKRFLSHFIDRNRESYRDVRFQPMGVSWPHLKERSDAAIDIFRTTLRGNSKQRESIDNISVGQLAILTAPSFNYTLASSHSSSTLSSMRRLAVKISQQSRLSSISLESDWTWRTPIDELSDRMSVLTLPAVMPEE